MNELSFSEMQQVSGGGARLGGVLGQRDGDLSMCGGARGGVDMDFESRADDLFVRGGSRGGSGDVGSAA